MAWLMLMAVPVAGDRTLMPGTGPVYILPAPEN
jgi:hypothetical protein